MRAVPIRRCVLVMRAVPIRRCGFVMRAVAVGLCVLAAAEPARTAPEPHVIAREVAGTAAILVSGRLADMTGLLGLNRRCDGTLAPAGHNSVTSGHRPRSATVRCGASRDLERQLGQ